MMQESNWIRIAPADTLPLQEGRAVKVGDLELAVFNLGNRILAVENACPHQGGPLCDGIVSGNKVVCPLHSWKFDLDTGLPVAASRPGCVATFPTRVEDGILLVNIAGGHRMLGEEAA